MTTLFPLPSPTLPDFTTLLVAGPLHASAPIHLCLSHLANRPGTTALLISPSRQTFLNSLIELSDDWINECGGFGAVSSLLAKVTSLYPPTPLHLAVALSMLKVAGHTDEPAFTAKVPLAAPPALIVLNEPSTFFVDEPSATLSSYLGVVTIALETIASFGTTTTALVVIDSRLHELKLPLVEGPGDGGRAYVPHLAFDLARQYFEWIALIEQDDAASEEQDHQSKSLTLTQVDAKAPEAVVWKWIEASAEQRRGFSERAGTTFLWPEDNAL
ncbi:hypothetical protein PENSPDRAFT_757664 [Peniophora sp. CONT]|nr:hypothetical protein PENSPDRAFT_757664 [Peniophora sp. CONT]